MNYIEHDMEKMRMKLSELAEEFDCPFTKIIEVYTKFNARFYTKYYKEGGTNFHVSALEEKSRDYTKRWVSLYGRKNGSS